MRLYEIPPNPPLAKGGVLFPPFIKGAGGISCFVVTHRVMKVRQSASFPGPARPASWIRLKTGSFLSIPAPVGIPAIVWDHPEMLVKNMLCHEGDRILSYLGRQEKVSFSLNSPPETICEKWG
jgi:hypothetical protein